MKKAIFILILACCFACTKEEQEKFFEPDKISLLELEAIDGFWSNEQTKNTSFDMGAHFTNYTGFIKGLKYSENKRAVWISVFKSQAMAIDAMQFRSKDVACVIESGNTDVVKGKWWFSKCSGTNIVIVNQWNTIIEVDCDHANFEEVKSLLYNTLNELAQRVDDLSK